MCVCRCHLIQASLRPAGSKEYVIPRGFLFDYITCANYTAEICAWLCFAMGTQTLAAFFFAAAGTCQMVPWAIQKHKRLRKVMPFACIKEMWCGVMQQAMLFVCKEGIQVVTCVHQTFDGKDGRPRYPRRWVIFPLLF